MIAHTSIALDELLRDIDLCNNGYIFAPTAAQMETAKNHPDVISIRHGRVCRTSLPRDLVPYPAPKSFSMTDLSDCDVEGAILSRQENRDLYY